MYNNKINFNINLFFQLKAFIIELSDVIVHLSSV